MFTLRSLVCLTFLTVLPGLAWSQDDRQAVLGLIVILVGWISIIGYLVLQPYFAWRWSGGWRFVALLPLIATIPLFVTAWLALRADSNLWPILLIFFMPLAFLYLLVAAAVRRFARRARP
jgi:hypothetical protein